MIAVLGLKSLFVHAGFGPTVLASPLAAFRTMGCLATIDLMHFSLLGEGWKELVADKSACPLQGSSLTTRWST